MNDVRWLTQSDMPATAALEALCFPSAWTGEQFSRAWGENWFTAYGSFSAGSLVAYIALSLLEDELEVLNIAVHPAYRGRGLSRPLMGYALEKTLKGKCPSPNEEAGRGWVRAFLEVRPSNAPAVALYKSLGFRQIGIRKRYYHNGEDAALFSLEKQAFLNAWKGEKNL